MTNSFDDRQAFTKALGLIAKAKNITVNISNPATLLSVRLINPRI